MVHMDICHCLLQKMSRNKILSLGIIIVGCFISFHLLVVCFFDSDRMNQSDLSLQQKITKLPHQLYSKMTEKMWSADGKYALHTFIWPSETAEKSTFINSCLASHTTVDGLHWLAKQADYYQGPISVAVFTPGKDIDTAIKMINYLKHCQPAVKELVSFHILFPISNQANFTNDILHDSNDYICGDPEGFNLKLKQQRRQEDILNCQVYPQNIARNLAWSGCKSSHVLNVDVDMIPPRGLASMLEGFLSRKKNCDKCAYILPVYEIENRSDFPVKDKDQLITLLEKKVARRFHIEVYDKNQQNSQLEKWEKRPLNSSLDVMYSIPKYEEYWEPIMVLESSAPKFLESFIGYGFTRSSHNYLLYSEHYSFKVLDLAYLSHFGFQSRNKYPLYRAKQIKSNTIHYMKFKKDLKEKKLDKWQKNEKRYYILFNDMAL